MACDWPDWLKEGGAEGTWPDWLEKTSDEKDWPEQTSAEGGWVVGDRVIEIIAQDACEVEREGIIRLRFG